MQQYITFYHRPVFVWTVWEGNNKPSYCNWPALFEYTSWLSIPLLQEREIKNIIVMQDEAPPHIFNPVFKQHFWRPSYQQINLGPRSPDINPVDFCLWGEKVFLSKPNMNWIPQNIAAISAAMLRTSVYNIQKENGVHIQHLQ